MSELIHNLTTIGSRSIHIFWMPLLLWTLLALLLKVILHYSRGLSPRHLYHAHLALLAALPLGYLSYSILHSLPSTDTLIQSIPVIPFQMPVTAGTTTTTVAPKLSVPPEAWFGLLMIILVTGALYMFIRLIISQIKLWQYRRGLHQLNQEKVAGISTENGHLIRSIRRNIRLAYTSDDMIPMTFGLIQPVILLPVQLQKDSSKLNLAIHHELEHIRQHDYLRFWLVRLLKAFFWFHPLLWLLERETVLYREMDIDETVISHNKDFSSDYAHLLLDLAGSPAPQHLLPTGLAARPSTIKQRITAMTHSGKTHNHRWIPAAITILTLLIALVMGCSDMQNQDLSGKELMNQELSFKNPRITINGTEIMYNAFIGSGTIGGPALGITYFATPNHGTFTFSGQSFEGAKPVGKVLGRTLTFTVNSMHVVVTSENNLLPEGKATLWVGSDPDFKSDARNMIRFGWVQDFASFQKVKNEKYGLAKHIASGYNNDTKQVYVVVEKMPRLIGGLASIQSRIQYPELARKAGIEGKVYVEFVVDENGNVVDPKVIRGIGGGCDQAALDAVKQAKFEPGMQHGKPVKVRYSVPIVFKLP